MSFRFTVLETSLNRAEFRWKCLRLLQRLSTLGIALCGILLLLGLAIVSGWLVDKKFAVGLLVAIGLMGLVAFVVTLLSVAARSLDRRALATEVERKENRLLDRLSALLLLEERRGETRASSFAYRIARQAQEVLIGKPPVSAFSAKPAIASLAALLLAGAGLVLLNEAYKPWNKLAISQFAKSVPKQKDRPFDLPTVISNNVEPHRAWGEVRITDPGADVKATKVDVVPLQIEAAANEQLKQVRWVSALNGGAETIHELPAPAEPRYGVYEPTLYLDELNVSDWDVLTYYAQASTESNRLYASQVYFVEVRPFREDIAKMPGGGEGGKPYQAINEITGLINRQQHVIRETHQHIQRPPASDILRTQDKKKLSDAEHDLSGATQHLYAKMATEMENQPIGDALDNLAKAQGQLDDAAQKLQSSEMPGAQNEERAALSSLVAARKMFQKAVSDNPGAFDEEPAGAGGEESPAVAESGKALQRMAEFRNESRAAQEFLQKTLEQQRSLEQKSKSAALHEYSQLSAQERQLSQELRNFSDQHPQSMKGAESQAEQAHAALDNASRALQDQAADVRTATHQATEALEQFAQKAQGQALGHQLADAYKLKQMVDQQAQALERASSQDAKASPQELKKSAEQAKQTVDQIKKMAEEEPTKAAFGQPLRDALAGSNKVDLDASLEKLQTAEDETSRRQSSAEASKRLRQLSKAFTDSEPKSLQMAQQSDSLKQSEGDRFSKGMAELDSLLKQLRENRPLSDEDQTKQAEQARADLQQGMNGQFGESAEGQDLLTQLDRTLKGHGELDAANLQKLYDALQRFSAEASEKLDHQEDKPELANINSWHLPPAYRGRIQKYFEKLSEK